MNQEQDHPQSHVWLGRLGIFLTVLLIAINFHWINYYGVNIPFLDDHGRIYRFMLELEEKESTSEKLEQLVRHQTNEHRIVTSHFTYLGLRSVFGEINLKWLMFASGALLVVTYCVMYVSVPIKDPRKPLFLLPLAMFMFVPMHQSSNWGLQYCIYVCYANVFLSLWLLHHSRERFWLFPLALVTATLATYSFGSGMFVFLGGAVLCVLPRLSWVRLSIWTVVGAALIASYFAGLELPDNRIPVLENLANNYPRITGFYFAFLATGVKNLFAEITPQIAFGVFLACLALVLMWKYREKLKANPLVLSFVIYLIVLIGPTSISRSAHGIDSANSIRFQLTSTVVLACFYLLFWATCSEQMKRGFGIVMTISVLLFASRMSTGFSQCEPQLGKLKSDLIRFEMGETPLRLKGKILSEAIEAGMYQSPAEDLFHTSAAQPCKLPSDLMVVQGRSQVFLDKNGWFQFRGFAVIRNEKTTPTAKWLVFTNEDNDRYRVWAAIQHNAQAGNALKNLKAAPSVDVAGYELIGQKKDLQLPDGVYDVGILVRNEDGKRGFRDLKLKFYVGVEPPEDNDELAIEKS